jgi:hypothetical protein
MLQLVYNVHRNPYQIYNTNSNQIYNTNSNQIYNTNSNQIHDTNSNQIHDTNSNQIHDTNSNQIHSIIPLNIFQTWHTLDLPPKMKETVNLLKINNPEFIHHLYDDNMCREFISSNFDHDVLYTFDKLKPGAYKVDLWRYCILYIKGGIYLDIKFECINGFKLITLTDKEYYVKTKYIYNNSYGIYNGFLVCLPFNNKLLKVIYDIVDNVKNTVYFNISNFDSLSITGSILLNKQFIGQQFFLLECSDCGNFIESNNKKILKIYKEYVNEKQNYCNENNFVTLYKNTNVYNFLYLTPIYKKEFTRIIKLDINNHEIPFFTSNPCIIKYNDNYILNIRWINYTLDNEGNTRIHYSKSISLNSYIKLDNLFAPLKNSNGTTFEFLNGDIPPIIYNNAYSGPSVTNIQKYTIINESNEEKIEKTVGSINSNISVGIRNIFEVFSKEDSNYNDLYNFFGVEDIRLFNYLNKIYFIGSCFNRRTNTISIVSDNIILDDKNYIISKKFIQPDFYNNDRVEKNWCFLNYKEELCIVYQWYPLTICKINYEENKINILEQKYLKTEYFKNVKGSTSGVNHNNEIWFILHKSQQKNYQHFFAVFDLNMNLLRYSEPFKLNNCLVEFCIGLIIEESRTILSFSSLDTNIFVCVYDNNYINSIKWYLHT